MKNQSCWLAGSTEIGAFYVAPITLMTRLSTELWALATCLNATQN